MLTTAEILAREHRRSLSERYSCGDEDRDALAVRLAQMLFRPVVPPAPPETPR